MANALRTYVTHRGRHISGGTDAFLSTDVLEAAAKRVRETGDPQILAFGTVADGGILVRSGATIIGTSTPSVSGITLTGATASRLVATDGSKALVSVADLTSWVAGTTNQVNVTNDGDGTITLGTPQNIHPAATPTFAGMTLTGNLTFTAGADATINVSDAFGLIFKTSNTAAGKVLSSGELFWGPGTPALVGTETVRVLKDQNATTRARIDNTNTGASSRTDLTVAVGSTLEVSGTLAARFATLDVLLVNSSGATGGLTIGALGTSSTNFVSTNSLTVRGKIISTGELIWGDAFTSIGSTVLIQAQASATNSVIASYTLSASSEGSFQARNSSGLTLFAGIAGTGVGGTRFGQTNASMAFIGTNTIASLAIGTTTAFPLYLATNNTVKVTVDSAGNTVQGLAALATTATDGFIYSAGCAGTPTGVPTTYTGRAPVIVDTTNNILYFYSTGAWRALNPAAGGGGWTDDGVVVRLTTSTDAVSIGSATENAKLYILGDDATQTTLRVDMTAGAGATIKLVDLRGNSGGTPAFTYDNAGNLGLFVAQADANPGVLLTSAGFSIGAGGGSAVDTRLLRAAANVWQIDNAAGGAAFLSWAASSLPTVAGRVGMDLTTGRMRQFADGRDCKVATTCETIQGPRITRTMVYNAGSQTVAVYGMSGQTTTGSQANIHTTLYGEYLRYTSAGALNDDAGWSPDAYDHTRRRYEPIYETGYMPPSTITDIRVMIGMVSGDPMGSATPAVHGAWFRYDTGTDGTAEYRACTNDGGGAPTVTNTGVAFTSLVGVRLKIVMDSVAGNVRFYINDVLVATHTTDLPSIDQDLAHHEETRALVAAARQHHTQKTVWSAMAGVA